MTPFPIPPITWHRALGVDWTQPYRVRYASNLDDGPHHGMPLGGFGAGCIGRSPAGDFNLWHLDGGEHWFETLPACQFSIFEQAEGEAPQAYRLSVAGPNSLQSFPSDLDWPQYPPSSPDRPTGTYHALYPRSWSHYHGVFHSDITCAQFSPILPHNYETTSYPLAVFDWTLTNPTDRPLTLSILLTWHNSAGWFRNTRKSPEIEIRDDGSPVYDYVPAWGQSLGNFNCSRADRQAIGLLLNSPAEDRTGIAGQAQAEMGQVGTGQVGTGQVGTGPTAGQPEEPSKLDARVLDARVLDAQIKEGQGQWAIATLNPAGLDRAADPSHADFPHQAQVFSHSRWNPSGAGTEIWRTFAQNGSLVSLEDNTPAAADEQVAVALAVRFTLAPGETVRVPFTVAWDFPVTEFAQGVNYKRRYCDFWGDRGQNAWSIACQGLAQRDQWQGQIEAWQRPILSRQDWPEILRMALFNELYLLTQGGSLWTAASEADPVGQFGVLECLDYAWYESLDVRLYGSFGLLTHWPELEKSVMRAFARAIPQADDRQRVIGYYVTQGQGQVLAPRKLAQATPHDLGAPNEHPWEKTNYTAYQDCNLWKDLGSDFVLQVYRDFVLTGAWDQGFVAECWPAVVAALHYLKGFDLDGDGIPENAGAPDQTFDDWRLKGVSAYCGGLWLAALEAAIALGQILAKLEPRSLPAGWDLEAIDQEIQQFQAWLNQSQPRYQDLLWNGQFYNLDSESGSPVVMADQLCGAFYARLLGLPDIVPSACIQSTLATVYDACFLKFHGGQYGAANGLLIDGSPLNPDDTHPLEVWTGINFGLAAFLLQQGQREAGFRLAEVVVGQIYGNGLQFRTPEAITAVGTFRASHYLRAMAIWAIETVDRLGPDPSFP